MLMVRASEVVAGGVVEAWAGPMATFRRRERWRMALVRGAEPWPAGRGHEAGAAGLSLV